MSGDARVYGGARVSGNISNNISQPEVTLPDKAGFIAYKGCKSTKGEPTVVMLWIPEDAQINRESSSRKYRASKAIVRGIIGINRPTAEAHSFYDNGFTYIEGDEKEITNFDTSPAECAPGIHFYLSFQEALSIANHGI